MASKDQIRTLQTKANAVRKDIIKIISKAGSGHPGGSLGITDILVALYFKYLYIHPKKPKDINRDYVVLSHGHVCPALYSTLAQKGYFSVKELSTLRKFGSRLQGHPHRTSLPGLETTSGPLGSGISQASGMAIGLKLDKKKNRVICLTSDGEHDEGNTWEAILFAHKYHLGNLTVIIDRNRIQLSGETKNIMPLQSLREKYLSFGWGVIEIDGNNMFEICDALEQAFLPRDKPLAIIANTTLGKGISFMENNYVWHGKAPNEDETKQALKELDY